MTAFDAGWALIKAWGEGFRMHGFAPDAPAVTELVPMISGNRNLNPIRSRHEFRTDRGSGTGVSGTYYHGGPFDPLWSRTMGSELEDLMRQVEATPDSMSRVYVPPPNNPIATTPRMRRMSVLLLENVLNEMKEHGAWSRPHPQHREGASMPPIEGVTQARTPRQTYRSGRTNTNPALYALPKTFEDEVDLMASIYDLGWGDYWRNVEDLVGSNSLQSLGGTMLQDSRLFDYLGQTPLVRRVMGEDYGQHDDEEYNWVNDPDVLRVLGERIQDTGGLSPMNILLGEYGHDAVVPISSADRGTLRGRETTQGSVLLPPTTDDWWEDYHPMSGGAFEPLQPEHVGAWMDNFERVKEIVGETDRGRRMQKEGPFRY